MEVVNVLEKIVWDNMASVMERKPEACVCEMCRADIAAYALNKLKPKYVASPRGETISKALYLDNQVYLTVIVALTEEVEVVSIHPHHAAEGR